MISSESLGMPGDVDDYGVVLSRNGNMIMVS